MSTSVPFSGSRRERVGNAGNRSHSWEPLWLHVQHKPQPIILVAGGVALRPREPARSQVPKPWAWREAPRLQKWAGHGLLLSSVLIDGASWVFPSGFVF